MGIGAGDGDVLGPRSGPSAADCAPALAEVSLPAAAARARAAVQRRIDRDEIADRDLDPGTNRDDLAPGLVPRDRAGR